MWTAVRTLVSCFIYKFLLNSVPHTPRVYVAWGGSYCTYFCVCSAQLSSTQLGFGDIPFKWLSTCAELIWCFQIIVYWPKKYKEFPYLCFCIRFTFIHISTIFVWKFSKKTNLNFHFIFGELRCYPKLYTIFYLAVDVKQTKFIQSLVHSCATHKKQLGYIGDRRSKRIRKFRCMAEIKLDHISLVVISCVLFFYCLFDNWIFRCLD